MLVVEKKETKLALAQVVRKGWLGGGKKLVLVTAGTTDQLTEAAAVLLIDSELGKVVQVTVSSREELAKAIQNLLVRMGVTAEEYSAFTITSKKEQELQRYLVVLLQRQLVQQLLTALAKLRIKVVRLLPETLVLYRLLKDELAGDELRLVINIDHERSQLYLIDKNGPRQAWTAVATSRLIPVVQKLFREQPQLARQCTCGVYWGEESLAFDARVFTEQTGVELIRAEKIFRRHLAKLGFRPKVEHDLNLFVGVGTAAILFRPDEMLDLQMLNVASAGKNKTNIFLPHRLVAVIGGGLIITGLVLGGWRLFASYPQNLDTAVSVITPTVTPSPLPTPTVSPQAVKIRILNGSGKKGAANNLAAFLRTKNFVIVETGNASSFDFSGTEVYYKQGAEHKLKVLLKYLQQEVEVATTEASLREDAPVDIEIILGR